MITGFAFATPLSLASPLAPNLSTVEGTLRSHAEATRTYDVVVLDRVFHPEYVEVSPLGEMDERSRVLSFYRTKPQTIPSTVRIDQLKVKFPAKDVATAIYRSTFVVGTAEISFRVSVVLHRAHGEWRLYGLQATGIRPTPRGKSASPGVHG